MKHPTILKTFFKYVSLNVFGMIGLSCCILTDTFFISRGVGVDGLTALNLALPIFSLITATGFMIGIGGATKYSILKAQGDDKEANIVFTHAFSLALILGLILFFIGMTSSSPISYLMGADEVTHDMTTTYLRNIFGFAPFYIMNHTILAFVRNDNAPKLAMAGTLIANAGNIILDYIFIFPFGWGMFGASLATGLSPIMSMIVLAPFFLKKKNHFHLIRCKLHPMYIMHICSLGISSFITEISSGIVIIVFNMIILSLEGNTGVAAFGVITNLALVVLSVFNGVSQGAQPLISTNYGKGDAKNVKKLLRYSILLSLSISTVIYLFTFFGKQQLVAVFNSEQNASLTVLAEEGLLLYFTAFFFIGINVVITSFLSSVELPTQSFIVSSLRGFALIIPVVFLLSKLWGMTGVWLAYPCAELITLLIAILLLSKAPVLHTKKA